MAKSKEYRGRNLDEVLTTISEELNIPIEEIDYKVTEEKGLLSKSVIVEVVSKEDKNVFVKDLLLEILTGMGLEVNAEVLKRERTTIYNVMSDNNALLIGKEGRNLESIQNYIRNVVSVKFGSHANFVIDVENYKQKKQNKVVKLAHRLADEATRFGEPVKMKNLNSFERRLVHEALSKCDVIKTYSEGEGRDRCLVIEAIEDN